MIINLKRYNIFERDFQPSWLSRDTYRGSHNPLGLASRCKRPTAGHDGSRKSSGHACLTRFSLHFLGRITSKRSSNYTRACLLRSRPEVQDAGQLLLVKEKLMVVYVQTFAACHMQMLCEEANLERQRCVPRCIARGRAHAFLPDIACNSHGYAVALDSRPSECFPAQRPGRTLFAWTVLFPFFPSCHRLVQLKTFSKYQGLGVIEP